MSDFPKGSDEAKLRMHYIRSFKGKKKESQNQEQNKNERKRKQEQDVECPIPKKKVKSIPVGQDELSEKEKKLLEKYLFGEEEEKQEDVNQQMIELEKKAARVTKEMGKGRIKRTKTPAPTEEEEEEEEEEEKEEEETDSEFFRNPFFDLSADEDSQ